MDDVWKPPSYESQQPASAPDVWPHTPAAGRMGSRVPMVVALGVAVVGMVLAVVGILVTGGETAGYRTWHQQSGAMEPTYPEGSDVTVKPTDGSSVRPGDVVLFSARDWGADSVFMMRVIAAGGDHVVLVRRAGAVWVDFDAEQRALFGQPVGVRMPDGRAGNPLGKVLNRFDMGGPEDSLQRFWLMLHGRVRRPAA
jgi:hypothetical protein